MKNKKSFILFKDTLSVLDELTNEQAGILFKAIKSFQNDENFDLDFGLRMAFIPFKNQFMRDNSKWNDKSNTNKINGSKGGKAKHSKRKRTLQVDSERYSGVANLAVNVNDNVNVNVNETVSDKVNVNENININININEDEVVDYFVRNNYKKEVAKKFFAYYSASNWVDSKGKKVKNWKQKAQGVWFTEENKNTHQNVRSKIENNTW